MTAEREQFYTETNTVEVPVIIHTQLQGEVIQPKGYPFKNGKVDHYPVVVADNNFFNNDETTEVKRNLFNLTRVSRGHARSFEIASQLNGTKIEDILWEDEYGNYFLGISTKGNDLRSPFPFKHDVTPSGFAYHGLQDSDSIVRVLRASRELRKRNVDTEVITKLIEPTSLPIGDTILPISDFKNAQRLIVWEANLPDDSSDDKESSNVTRDDLPNLSMHLDRTVFFITERAALVNERLRDFEQAETKEEFVKMLRKVFKAINAVEERWAQRDPEFIAWTYDAESPDSISEYFKFYLPYWIASNLAELHNAGLLHKYLHLGNVLATGGVCDLDSVVGETLGLGDDEIPMEVQTAEATSLFNSYYSMLIDLSKKGYVDIEVDSVERDDGEIEDISLDAIRIYTKMHLEYARLRSSGKLDILATVVSREGIFETMALKGVLGGLSIEHEEWLEIFTRELGWDFQTSVTPIDSISRLPEYSTHELPKFQIGKNKAIKEAAEILMLYPSATDKVVGNLKELVLADFEENYTNRFQKIKERYNPNLAQLIKSLYIEREVFKLKAPTLEAYLSLNANNQTGTDNAVIEGDEYFDTLGYYLRLVLGDSIEVKRVGDSYHIRPKESDSDSV